MALSEEAFLWSLGVGKSLPSWLKPGAGGLRVSGVVQTPLKTRAQSNPNRRQDPNGCTHSSPTTTILMNIAKDNLWRISRGCRGEARCEVFGLYIFPPPKGLALGKKALGI